MKEKNLNEIPIDKMANAIDQIIEILNVTEFAERLQVSRATVFDWIRLGKLKAGRHFFKIGRVLRFRWSPSSIELLFEDFSSEVMASEKTKSSTVKPVSKKYQHSSGINWDY